MVANVRLEGYFDFHCAAYHSNQPILQIIVIAASAGKKRNGNGQLREILVDKDVQQEYPVCWLSLTAVRRCQCLFATSRGTTGTIHSPASKRLPEPNNQPV